MNSLVVSPNKVLLNQTFDKEFVSEIVGKEVVVPLEIQYGTYL